MSQTRFHFLLEKKVQEAVDSLTQSIARGAATDYAQYKENVGVIRGLQMTIKLCDEVEEDLSK